MAGRTPKVSIGLAVYNGEWYLEQAIQSLLSQTFSDFELIISDNASTDHTAEICKKYAASDPRIRYHRNVENIGGANNENLTIKLSRGEYFRWAAHDDICAPELLERCVEVLDRDRSVVLCHSWVVSIDENGNPFRTTARNKGSADTPLQRFRELSNRDHDCEATYGLIRTDILRKTRLQKNYTDSDRTLLCELSLYGKFYEIPEPLFYKRFHPGNVYLDWRGRMLWFNPSINGKITFPNWMQFFDYLETIRRVPLRGSEKFKLYAFMSRWFLKHCKYLLKDLLTAVYLLVHSPKWRSQWYASADTWS